MKKMVFSCLILTIIGIGILSCGLKNRLPHNTVTIAIEPVSIDFIRFNSSQSFSAIVKNAKGELMDVDVNWSISGFSNVSISSGKGKSVTLQTGGTECLGILTAEYRGVTSSIDIDVTNDFILYKNGKWSKSINLNNLIYNPDSNSNLIKMEQVTDQNDGTCLQFTVSPPEAGAPGAFYLIFNPLQDLSAYGSIQFSAKCMGIDSSVNFNVYMIQNDGQEGYQEDSRAFNVGGDSWSKYVGALTKQRNNVVSPLKIEFTHSSISDGQTRTIRINNIRIDS
ncbi:MAG: hypothetical protein LBD17_06570 [Endomicrobium sp.]|jgi:hypothetical protein|nr:hypothetical protein [Endomicrobium sp.]